MKLSICMMVKNESKYLKNCLKSLQPVRDAVESELIIVDTGSEDNTAEIAKGYTDKVYFHKWNDDFSGMRNKTISYASGQWIFIIDADEVLQESQPIIEFLSLSKDVKIGAVAITGKSITDEKKLDEYSIIITPRLFKNDGYFHYEGTVHNQPIFKGALREIEASLLHYGYVSTDQELMEKKFLRTSVLLKKELEKDPSNIYYWFQLAVTYGMYNKVDQAIEYIEKAYQLFILQKDPEQNMYVLPQRAHMYRLAGNYQKVEEICLESLKIKDDCLDIYYYLAEAQAIMEKDQEAIKNYKKYLNLRDKRENTREKDTSVIDYTLGNEQKAYFNLSLLCRKVSNYDEALEYGKKINRQDYICDNFRNVIDLFVRKGQYRDLRVYHNKNIQTDYYPLFYEAVEDLKKEYNNEIRLAIAKVFNDVDDDYGLLSAMIVDHKVGKFSDETLKRLQQLDFSKLPSYCSEMLYYLLKMEFPLQNLLTDFKEDWLNVLFDSLAKNHDNFSAILYEYLYQDGPQNTVSQYKLSKALCRYLLFIDKLTDEEYHSIFDRYIRDGISYMKIIYNHQIIDNALVYDLKNDEEVFLVYMYQAQRNENINQVAYLRYLRQAMNIMPEMKRAVAHLADVFNKGRNFDIMEMEAYKEQIKSSIRELIEQEKTSEALSLINDYESIVIDDLEVISMKAVIAIKQGRLDQAKGILDAGILINKNNFDLNYNLAYVYEQLYDFKKAVFYYKIAKDNCLDYFSKQELEQYIKKIAKQHEINLQCNNEQMIRKILFIQSVPDIRTNKIACVLKDRGIQVDVMYFEMHPQEAYEGLQLPYENIYRLKEIKGTVTFINNSDYDIVFSCNEPDFLSALLLCSNKPLIHDSHDMMSLRGNISNEQLVIEYLANCKCDGNIYVTDLVEKVARKKFELDDKPVMLLDNYILKTQLPQKFLKKLSESDGEIHCVYEGGLTNIDGHHRNIEKIFLKLAKNNIHVHFYTGFANDYYVELGKKSLYLHYEGTKEPNELIEEMTKYDIGLAVLNVTEQNKTFLDTTFPNKAWEYLAAKLPILFSDLESFGNFVKKYQVGEIIDDTCSLKKQIARVSEIKVKKDFLVENGLYMENFSENLISFLQEVQKNKNNKNVISLKNTINKNIKMENLSVIIPTRNRHNMLTRCIKHFLSFNKNGLNVNIIILDSSDEIINKKNREFINKNNQASIKYVHYNDEQQSFFEKINDGFQYVTDEYCCICADDDFFNEEGIVAGINLMQKRSDIGVVKGKTAIYYNNPEEVYCPAYEEASSILHEDKTMRLEELTSRRITQLIYVLFRKEILTKVLHVLNDESEVVKQMNLRFIEYLFYFLVGNFSKIYVLDVLFNVRNYNELSETFQKNNFSDTVADKTFNENYILLRDILTNVLNKKDNVFVDRIFNNFIVESLGVGQQYIKLDAATKQFDLELLLAGFKSQQQIKESHQQPFDRVYIEIAGACNAKCHWCVTGYENKKDIYSKSKKQNMSYDEFKKVIDHLRKKKIIHQDTCVNLYNWGEPFLNKDFKKILNYLTKLKLRYSLSTNASIPIDFQAKDTMSYLNAITFSMCGFSQDSYAHIHQLSFNNVKENIVKMLTELRKNGFKGSAALAFHIYKFNVNEIELAKQFAEANGIVFCPSFAYINDYDRLKEYLSSTMNADELKQAEEELFLKQYSHEERFIPENYYCNQHQFLVINERSQILQCCVVDKVELGNILEQDLKSLYRLKNEMKVCMECKKLSIDYLTQNPLTES